MRAQRVPPARERSEPRPASAASPAREPVSAASPILRAQRVPPCWLPAAFAPLPASEPVPPCPRACERSEPCPASTASPAVFSPLPVSRASPTVLAPRRVFSRCVCSPACKRTSPAPLLPCPAGSAAPGPASCAVPPFSHSSVNKSVLRRACIQIGYHRRPTRSRAPPSRRASSTAGACLGT